jgi:putative DNA primase/helicase
VGKRYADSKKDLSKDIARSCEKFEAEGGRTTNEASPAANLPEIQVKGGQLSSLATKAEDLLLAAGVPLYQRGGTLVRPIIETVDATRGRRTRVAQLKVLDNVYMRDLLGRHAIWIKWDARSNGLVRINPPAEVAATVLARVGDWKVPAIRGVISAPTMRSDGSLLTEQGYDDVTGLLLVEPPPMPGIPGKPTREDALKALALLESLLTGFPFVDDIARACALSAMITPVVRGAFSVTPLHASRAPTAGSGKSFLWDIVAAIAIGQPMPVMSTGADTEETEKRLGAALLAGQPLISLDNISSELGGDALCQIIERPVVEVRILGRSERVRIEARGTSLFATGNNFVVVGDVCRRVITTNLDPAMEQPELRQFDFDPVDRILENRGKYIAAALTICRAYFVAGRPNQANKLASFEGWSDTVRSALIWLGKEDPVKSMENARAEDPERVELSNMLEAWSAVIGIGSGNRLKLSAVLSKGLDTTREYAGSDLEPTYPEFHAALLAMAFKSTGKRGQQPDTTMLGNYLRKFKGRVIDGKRFMNLPNEKRGAQWWVEQVLAKPETAAAA